MKAFKKNSWHAMWYKSFFGMNYISESGCLYFWSGLLALILTPIAIPSIIYNLYILRKKEDYSFTLVPPQLGMAITMLIALLSNSVIGTLWMIGMALLSLGIVTLLVAIALGIERIISKYVPKKEKKVKVKRLKEKKTYLIVEAYNGFFDKYCPKIKWED